MLSKEFLSELLKCDKEQITFHNSDIPGGLTNNCMKMSVISSGETKDYFIKWLKSDLCKQIGLSREVDFFEHLAHIINVKTPTVYFAKSLSDKSEKTIVMEFIPGIQCGYFFGNGNPGTWSVDITHMTTVAPWISSRMAALKMFEAAAKIHSSFEINSLSNFSWLRGCDWLQGEGRVEWENGQKLIQECWRKGFKMRHEMKWDPNLVSLMDVSIGNALNWDNYRSEMQSLSKKNLIGFVHGDFHPGNALINLSNLNNESPSGFNLVMLDWEMAGIGSMPQELSQALISHMKPEERRECEIELLHSYAEVYMKEKQQKFSLSNDKLPIFEDVQTEYVRGGLAKWIWMLGYMISLDLHVCSNKAMQYFHDQIVAFMEDWGVYIFDTTPTDYGYHRVHVNCSNLIARS